MTALLETWKCSAKTFWRLRKWFNIRGPAVPTVEDGSERTHVRCYGFGLREIHPQTP